MKRTVFFTALLVLILGMLSAAAPVQRTRGGGMVASPHYRPRIFTKIFTVGQTSSTFAPWSTRAPWSATAQMVDCSATWAWDEVSSNYLALAGTDSAVAGAGVQARYDDYARVGYGDCSQSFGNRHSRRFAQNNGISNKVTLLYLPFEASIPSNATILSAELVISREGTQSMGGSAGLDTLWGVLMTNATDSAWRAGPNTGDNSAKFAGKRAASWANQVQPVRSDDSTYVNRRAGYPDSSAAVVAWSPSLSARVRPVDWGYRGLGYVVPTGFNNAADTSKCYVIDVKRPVQKAVSGSVNNGFALLYSSSYTTRTGSLRVSPNPANANHRPFLKVTYTTSPYNGGPWAGREVGFAFATDDGILDANDAYAAVFAARDLSYSVFVNQGHTEAVAPAIPKSNYAHLLQYWEDGMEIGSHGRRHGKGSDITGLLAWSDNSLLVSGAGVTVSGVLQDSLTFEMSPAWIDSGLAAVSGVDEYTLGTMTASPTCGKTMAAPQGGFTLGILGKAYDLGYYGFRSAGGYGAGSSSVRPIPGDTLGVMMGDGNAGNSWLRNAGLTTPRRQNNYAFRIGPQFAGGEIGIDVLTMNGATPLNNAATDSVNFKRAVRGLIDQAAANGNEYMVWLSHALASNPVGYTGLIDVNQLGWALDAMEESGNVAVMNFGTLAKTFQAGMLPVDHPAWGTLSWQNAIKADGPYPMWGIARDSYVAPAPATPALADTHYTIVATSPLAPRRISLDTRAHCWTATPTDSVTDGVAWTQLDYGSTSAKRDSAGYYGSRANDLILVGDAYETNISQGSASNNPIPIIHLPYTVPVGRAIAEARLFIYVYPSNPIVLDAAYSDTFFVFADTTSGNHELWYAAGNVNRPIWQTFPTASPWIHRGRSSYNSVVWNGSTAWSPTLASLDVSGEVGPSVILTSEDNPGSYCNFVGFDVTALIRDHTVYAFRLCMKTGDSTEAVWMGNPDAEIKAKRPFLLVKTIPTP